MKKMIKQLISNIIEPETRVLDLGCGDGSLLQTLIKEKNVTGYGIEMKFDNIKHCVARGISVYQGDLNEGLSEFSNKSFDYVSLSLTLQEVMDPVYLLSEILRVGKKGIVTFPNFGHWKIRLNYLFSGHTPKTKSLPYEWYNTPNIRVLTIKDFRDLCQKEKIKIVDEIPLFNAKWIQKHLPLSLSNLFSEKGVFILEK